MDDLLVRVAVASGLAVTAAAAAFAARRGRAFRRRPFEPTDLGAGLHLFTSLACASCARAREMLASGSHAFAEHSFEAEESVLRANHIERVPAVAHVSSDAAGSWISEGVPSARALARWLGP